MRKEKIHKYLLMITAVSLFGIFLFGYIILIHHITIRNKSNIIQSVKDIAIHQQMTIDYKISGNFQILRGISTGLSSDIIEDEGELYDFLNNAFYGNDFLLIGLLDSFGNSTIVDKDGKVNKNPSESCLDFLNSFTGEEKYSVTFYEPLVESFVNYNALCVKSKNGSESILWAASNNDILQNFISVPVMNGEGYFILINKNFEVVVAGSSIERKKVIGKNIFDYVEFEQDEYNRFKNLILTDNSGNSQCAINNVNHLITVQPLNRNNWFLLSIINQSYINNLYNTILLGSVVLLGFASIIFILLMYWQIRTSDKGKEELEKIAYIDNLTNISNYKKFLIDAQDILDKKQSEKYAVWTFDIKNFSRINNILGNKTGDLVLKRIARVFGENAPSDSVYCRLSSDIFAGLIPYKDKSELEEWFDKILKILEKREVIQNNQMHIEDAIGVYCAEDFKEPLQISKMINRATLARWHSKQYTGNNIIFFKDEMERKQQWLAQLEATGGEAIKNHNITFFLQPKTALDGKYTVKGAEALARWNHPVHGWISPGDFIPLYENNGFIIQLDRYIFENVCIWYKEFSKDINYKLQISVNVSRQGLLQGDFVEFYVKTKNKYNIPDNVLEVEFTESLVLNDFDEFRSIILSLQKEGFLCSIDDFGAGYSSLNMLKNLPIDILKLDARFFADSMDIKREQIVISNFVRMAHELGILTVAEGVELFEQVEFLEEINCGMVQGYVFSKPLSIKDFENLIITKNGIISPSK